MEKQIKKQRRKIFILSILAYMVGAGIYDILIGDKDILRFLSGAFFAAISNISLVLYENWKNPKMKEKKKILEEDERNIFLKGKAAYSALIITIYTLFALFLVFLIIPNILFAYIASGVIFYIFIMMLISYSYWNKRV